MLTDTSKWSHARGNGVVPYRWQATAATPTSVVRLANYDLTTASLDGFTFERGGRYLITATDETVSFCGYSAPWNQERADAFDEAFST